MSASSSQSIAAFLSFVMPGLGQLSLGAVRRGVLMSLPALGILAAGIAAVRAGSSALLEIALRPQTVAALLFLNVLAAGYHALAIVDAYGLAKRRSVPSVARRASVLVLATVLAATFAVHGTLEAVGYQAYVTLDEVFSPPGPGSGWSVPEPSPAPSASATPAPSPTPAPSSSPSQRPSPSPTAPPAWAADGRLNVLLIGSDAGPDRWSLRTDTIIVMSIEVATGRVALFSIPRNLVGVPLPPESAGAFANGRFPGMLNALYVYAMGHPASFPGEDARGFRALTGAVQELVGVALDGVVVVNLEGFVRLVDAIGGLWIDVPARLVDRSYPLEDGSGHVRLDFKPGCQLLDGRLALAYARSRHQDSDYGRMARQQAVLVALARQVDPLALLLKVPDLLTIAEDNLWTTIAREDVRGLAELAARAETNRVTTVRFVPPRYPSSLGSADIERIRQVVRSAFETPPPAAQPQPSTAPVSCP